MDELPISISTKDGSLVYSDRRKVSDCVAEKVCLQIGGCLQTDYRYYEEDCREDNRFDMRKARLFFSGGFSPYLSFSMGLEFQGNAKDQLLDAFAEIGPFKSQRLRFGQFKEPFSLEWQNSDMSTFFAERSMGYFLSPARDVGLMLRGSFLKEYINYSIGMFNGDGVDGSSRGSQSDEPEFAARVVLVPFKAIPCIETFQVGASTTYSNIDLANVRLDVKSSGMIGTNRSVYVLNASTKFGVLHEVEKRERLGLEAAWAIGPLLSQWEYMELSFKGLKPAGESPQDADFSSWYASVVLFLTGERPQFKEGVLEQVKPKRDFDPAENGWGGFCLAFRAERFFGDAEWIKKNAFTSIREAEAYSVAIDWLLSPMYRMIIDFTSTDLSDPLRVRVNQDGTINYIEKEHVLTMRFDIAF